MVGIDSYVEFRVVLVVLVLLGHHSDLGVLVGLQTEECIIKYHFYGS